MLIIVGKSVKQVCFRNKNIAEGTRGPFYTIDRSSLSAADTLRRRRRKKTWFLKHSTVSALWCRTAPRVPNNVSAKQSTQICINNISTVETLVPAAMLATARSPSCVPVGGEPRQSCDSSSSDPADQCGNWQLCCVDVCQAGSSTDFWQSIIFLWLWTIF